eukprot:TRINITY_DN4844_c5_g1_i1.p1 TRINITY_DN4844_c5_g1~~TRINITY_DN4844_c5_g1_i1.p1  ORF type:complete len:651 (+),score=232.44 TRINITY_DN4844_c5_g1_i1:84-2036(+)
MGVSHSQDPVLGGSGKRGDFGLVPLPYGGYAIVPGPKRPLHCRSRESHLNRAFSSLYRRPRSVEKAAVASVPPPPPGADVSFKLAPNACGLRVVHVADVYEFAAMPKLRSFIDRHRLAAKRAGASFVALFGGDWVSPYPLAQLDHGKGMTECLRLAGLTHTCLGNHEADIPPEQLRKRIEEWQAGGGVVINSNVPRLDEVIGCKTVAKSTVAVRSSTGGIRKEVAFIGAVTTAPALYGEGFNFDGALEGAPDVNEAVGDALQSIDADLVIPLTHQAIADDEVLCDTHGAGKGGPLLCVLGGHDHDSVVDTRSGCLLAKPGQDATTPLVLDIVWDEAGKPSVARAELAPVAPWPANQAVAAAVDRHLSQMTVFAEAPLLPRELCPKRLSSRGVRCQQTALGGLLCDSVREIVGVDAVFMEAGCVRAQKDYGESGISVADLRAELPWDTEMAIVKMAGRHLQQAVVASRSRLPSEFAGWLQHDTGVVCSPDNTSVVEVADDSFDPDATYAVAAIFHSIVKGMDDNPGFTAWREEMAAERELPSQEDCPPAKQLVRIAFARSVLDALPEWAELSTDGRCVSEADIEAAWVANFARPSGSIQGFRLGIRRLLDAADVDSDGVVSRRDYDTVRYAERGTFPLEHVFRLQERAPMG